MKRTLILISCLFPIIVLAQSSFTIKGYGKLLKDGDKIFLSYKQADHFIEDSTIVKQGKFEFNGVIKNMVRAYVCRNDNPKYAETLSDSFDLFIEPGTIILQSADTLSNAIIAGTPLNNDYAKLVASLKKLRDTRISIKAIDSFSAAELSDTVLVNLTKARSLTNFNKTTLLQLNFINQHPHSYVSLYTLSKIARTSRFLPAVEESFSKLDAKLKIMPEGKDISRRIVEGKKVRIGSIAKDFTQPDQNGKPVSLSSYKGKYLLIDFWASWCSPCREENPNVIAAYNQYKNKNFEVLSISIDVLANKQNWLTAITEDQLPWTQVSDLKKENEAAKLYGITTIPSNVLIDPSGKVIAKDLKGKELHEKLAMFLSQAPTH